MQLFANNADSSLNGAITSDTTVLALKVGEGGKFPSPANGDFFLVTLFERVGTTELHHEIVKCTSRAGDSLTVVRAQEGTVARAFNSDDLVELRITKGTVENFSQPEVLATKVDKVAGKGLSTEDYTTTEKTKLAGVEVGAQVNTVTRVAGKTGAVTLAKTDVGLGNVDNTSDANKPVSTAQKSALDAKAPTASPSFTNTATFQGVKETLTTANTGTAYTVANTAASILDLTLTGNCVLTYPAPSGGGQFTLLLKQDATGSRTVTWPSTVRWAGGTAPTLTATAGRTDVVTFLSDGTYWLGFVGGLNFTRA